MANNCLVKKLNSVVDNSSLVKIGEFKFKVTNDINDAILPFAIESESAFDAKIIGTGHFYKGTIDAQTNVTTEILNVTSTTGYRLSTGEYYIIISPKYGITSINISTQQNKQRVFEMNIDDLKYNDNPIAFQLNPSQTFGSDVHQLVTGDLSSLKEGSNLRVCNTDITGTMKDWAKYNFRNKTSEGNGYCVPSKYITGSIEDLVSNMNSVNYDKNNIELYFLMYSDNHITFHNEPLTSSTIRLNIDASGNAVVKDGNNTILATYTKATNTWTYN